MRIFLAGATGVLGRALVPRLLAQGHTVTAMTRSPGKTSALRQAGTEPVVVDVFDREALIGAVVAASPDLVMHQLTDLPDDTTQLAQFIGRNARIRREGTRHLLDAAAAAAAPRFIAQSVAWPLPPGPGQDAVAELEHSVLAAGGVVLRYGQLYGPGTFYTHEPPGPPRVGVDQAADRTVAALDAPSGVLTVVED